MKPWSSWHEAFKWCMRNAQGDCTILAKDWFDAGEYAAGSVAILKFQSPPMATFWYKGVHR